MIIHANADVSLIRDLPHLHIISSMDKESKHTNSKDQTLNMKAWTTASLNYIIYYIFSNFIWPVGFEHLQELTSGLLQHAEFLMKEKKKKKNFRIEDNFLKNACCPYHYSHWQIDSISYDCFTTGYCAHHQLKAFNRKQEQSSECCLH